METVTTPKCCDTCLYMATHELCNGCLTGKLPDGGYPFHNWKEGNWMGRIMWFELTGKRSIVIGGQGEADVSATDKPEDVSKNLHYVSEQCGYCTGRLNTHANGEKSVTISTTEGTFRLVWDAQSLKAIEVWCYDHVADKSIYTGKDFWNRAESLALLAVMDNAPDPFLRNYKD